MASTPERLDVRQAQKHLARGAWLVCAYHSQEKFEQNRLDGALSLAELRSRAATLAPDQELIFYCA